MTRKKTANPRAAARRAAPHRKGAVRTASAPARAASPAAQGAGVSRRQWEPIRKKLMVMREELSHAVRQKAEIDLGAKEVGDEADQATNSLEKEMAFELNDNERQMLDQIEGALRKMEKGSFGLCESCQKPIAKLRIQAVPFARYCIVCQSSAESAIV